MNLLSWWACERLFDWRLRGALNRERRRLGLADVASVYAHAFRTGTMLLATDPVLAPAPSDARRDVVTTGFWYLDEDDDPDPLDADLEAFLDAGAPPVYVGFGSMPCRNPERATRTVVEAIRAAGQRAVLHRGWAGLGAGDLPGSIHLVDGVSHARLFPRVSAVVHHGGAGTVAAALRAGVPQVVVPHLLDQFWWAARVQRLGVAAPAPPMRRLDGDALARAIRAASQSAGLRDRAQEAAFQLDARSGLPRAVAAIEAAGDGG
jgi:UDP:flavonoid glycosyltransferase YjiC (YdhE family)